MADKSHPLLTVDQQIEHMRANGVKFEIMNENDAKGVRTFSWTGYTASPSLALLPSMVSQTTLPPSRNSLSLLYSLT